MAASSQVDMEFDLGANNLRLICTLGALKSKNLCSLPFLAIRNIIRVGGGGYKNIYLSFPQK